MSGQADHPDYTKAHALIAKALLSGFDPSGQRPPPSYARRHLAEHANEAGELDSPASPFLTAETLPYLDPQALSRVLRLIEVEPHSALGFLLGAWRGVRHRWSWDRPEANAAALDMALTAAGARPPTRPKRAVLSWAPTWAVWSFGGTVVGSPGEPLDAIAVGVVAGRSCLVTADLIAGVQIWDAATSEPLGPAVPLRSRPNRIAIASIVGGEVVVVADKSGVRVSDALTGRERWRSALISDPVHALAAGTVGRRTVLAAGSSKGTVYLFAAENGKPIGSPMGDGATIWGLALAADHAGRTRLVAGHGDGKIEQWYLDATPYYPQVSPGPPAFESLLPVSDVAAASYQHKFFIATASTVGRARLWNADSGEPAGPVCVQKEFGGVATPEGIALAEASGSLLMATGGDTMAIVWDPFSAEQSSEPMPHPAAVLDVAFSVVDGRLMLATACADSNARLWDPIKPSGARVAFGSRILRTAFTDSDQGPLLVGGSADGGVFVWRADAGEQLREFRPSEPEELLPEEFRGTTGRATRDVAVGQVRGRTVVAAITGRAARVWDLSSGELTRELPFYTGGPISPADAADAIAVADSTVLIAYLTIVRDIECADLFTEQPRFRLHEVEPPRDIRFLHHSESGPVLAVWRNDKVQLVDVDSGLPRWPEVVGSSTPGGALGRIEEVDVFAFWRKDGIGLWNLTDGQPYGPGISHVGYATGLAVAKVEGQDLLLSAHYATVRVWHPQTGRLMTELPFGTTILSMAVSTTDRGDALVAVSGPGIAVAEISAVLG